MMDELKLIIEAIAGLPTIMVWVLLGYLLYKLAVIGSIYGLMRFMVQKAYDAYTAKRRVEVEMVLCNSDFDMHSTKAELIHELNRLKFIGKPNEYQSRAIHSNYGVKLLRETIDRMYEEHGVKK